MHVWTWWLEMNAERPNNGMAVVALTSKFMYDYLEVVHRTEPMAVELKILRTIDNEFIKATSSKKDGN